MAAKTAQKRGAQKRGETAPPAAIAALRRIAPAHVPDAALAALAKGGDAQKAKAEVTRWWREAAARATGAPTRKGQWWRELAASETDPISLEPLNRLRVEPFEIDEDGHKMLFDARVLAAYLVSSNVFANPLTRRPLRRETCASLDAHLEKHGRAKDATVARALDLSRDDDAQRRLQSERLRAESRRVLAALFGGDAESLGARQVRLAEDAARRAERGGGGLVVEDADVGVFQEAAPSAAPRPPPPDSAESYPVLESAPRRRDDAAFWARRAQAAPRGLFSAAPRPRAAPSTNDRLLARNRRLADAFGVDRQRAAQTVAWPPALVLCRAQNQPVSRRRREMLIHTQVLWAQSTLATHVDGLAGGGGALRALERKLARCCEADGEVPLPARATRADSTRAAEVAALYGLRAEEYADGAVRYLSCRRLPGARPPQPLLSEHAATAPPPPAPAPTAPPPPARAPPSPTSWTCDRCTLVNAPGTTVCQACDAERPREVVRGGPRGAPAAPEQSPPPEATPTTWEMLGSDDDDDEADDGGLTRPSPARVLTVAPDDVCVCCLELLALENTKVMACCGTTLHARCLSDWLAAAQRLSTEGDRVGESATCPNCRQVIPLSISVLPNPRMQYA